mgnify:CR=1 FL=1
MVKINYITDQRVHIELQTAYLFLRKKGLKKEFDEFLNKMIQEMGSKVDKPLDKPEKDIAL